MSTRLMVTILVISVFIFSGTVIAAQHGQRPGPQRAPSQYRPDMTPPSPAADRQHNTYREQNQQQRQDTEHRRDQMQNRTGPVDPVEMSDGNASPVSGAATSNAGQGEGTADAVKGAIEQKTGQTTPEAPGEQGTVE